MSERKWHNLTKKEFKFNKAYYDEKFKRIIEKNEIVKMTEERAEDIVKSVLSQSNKFKSYKNFQYRMVEDSEEINNGEN